MKTTQLTYLVGAALVFGLVACTQSVDADYVLVNGDVYLGDNSPPVKTEIAIKDDQIIRIGPTQKVVKSAKIIDAMGLAILPGFIDPHTHSIEELSKTDPYIRRNANYQTQGVTTVFNGNDGYGYPEIGPQILSLETNGIGTNTALFIGHGELRKSVMGGENRAPDTGELEQMKSIIAQDMRDGALGLSTGLFYAPGSFAKTSEIIELARVVDEYGGIYDSHIRDEATYNIGLEAAVDEVIEIAEQADIPVHIAHIKALGVDVWGKSETLISNIEAAQARGLSVTADQYPWRASGTRISNAILPRWVKAGTEDEYQQRLRNPKLLDQIIQESTENLRRRGGAEAILITQDNSDWQGKTLGQVADENNLTPILMAIEIAKSGDARIASFNMNPTDVENFMVQDWVMTSSDGSTGHPRKFASYPQKYQEYVIGKNLMPIETFFYKSSGLVADTFGLCDRGYLREGYKADIAIIDLENFEAMADFQKADALSTGVQYLFVNGTPVISEGSSQAELPGKVVKRCK